jgi:hypothetical protein
MGIWFLGTALGNNSPAWSRRSSTPRTRWRSAHFFWQQALLVGGLTVLLLGARALGAAADGRDATLR